MRSQLFRIWRGDDERWYVSPSSGPFKVHSFGTQLKAEEFATRWAKASQPSIVQVEVNGRIEREWTFRDDTPRIHWLLQHI